MIASKMKVYVAVIHELPYLLYEPFKKKKGRNRMKIKKQEYSLKNIYLKWSNSNKELAQ